MTPGSRAAIAPLVLVADDDRDTRDMYEICLVSAGYRVVLAIDGQDALELALSHHPQVILTDMLLPRLSGIDLCSRLRTCEDTRTIPIVAITGSSEPGLRREASQAGIVEILTKPCAPDVIVSVLQRVLETSRSDHAELS